MKTDNNNVQTAILSYVRHLHKAFVESILRHNLNLEDCNSLSIPISIMFELVVVG